MSPLIALLQKRIDAVRQLPARRGGADDDTAGDRGQRLAAFPYGGEILPLSGLLWVAEPWLDSAYAARNRLDDDAGAGTAEPVGGLLGWLSRRFG